MDPQTWRSSRGLLATLARSAATKSGCTRRFRLWNNHHIDHFWYNFDIYEEEVGFADAGFYGLIQIWLASLAPNFLTNEALPAAAARCATGFSSR